MAAQLVLSNGDVLIGETTYDGVTIVVRGGSAVLRQRGLAPTTIMEKPNVLTVTKPVQRQARWVVTFADGSQWVVTRIVKPCGCK